MLWFIFLLIWWSCSLCKRIKWWFAKEITNTLLLCTIILFIINSRCYSCRSLLFLWFSYRTSNAIWSELHFFFRLSRSCSSCCCRFLFRLFLRRWFWFFSFHLRRRSSPLSLLTRILLLNVLFHFFLFLNRLFFFFDFIFTTIFWWSLFFFLHLLF